MAARWATACSRAIAIATEKPYREVHDELTAIGWNYRHTYWRDADGLFVPGEEAQRRERAYIASLGLQWHPTMRIGSGCKVHLRADELPSGRIIARVTRHFGHLIVLRTNESPRFALYFASNTCRASFDELESGDHYLMRLPSDDTLGPRTRFKISGAAAMSGGTMPVELLRDGRGVYGIGVSDLFDHEAVALSCGIEPEPYFELLPGSLILRPDRLDGTKPRNAVLQKITGGSPALDLLPLDRGTAAAIHPPRGAAACRTAVAAEATFR